MSQCTCTTDKEATCIVHPTTRSLKEYIAHLEAIRDAAENVITNTSALFSEHRELITLLDGESDEQNSKSKATT
jgi:hypothetical protein